MDILNFISGREVFVIAIIIIIAMTLYGHNRGFVKMALSFASIIITLIIVNTATPYVSEFVSENRTVRTFVQERVRDFVEDSITVPEGGAMPEDEERAAAIAELPLPQIIKEKLEKETGETGLVREGMESIYEYVAEGLSSMIIKAVVFAVLFIAVSIGLRVLMHVMDLFTRLPVICGMNQLLGAGIGFLEAIFYIWIFMLLIAWLPLGEYAAEIFRQISESEFLSFLYTNNMISLFLLSLVGI